MKNLILLLAVVGLCSGCATYQKQVDAGRTATNKFWDLMSKAGTMVQNVTDSAVKGAADTTTPVTAPQ